MVERQILPDGLVDLPPGPGLALALARIDRTRCTGSDLYTVLNAQARQVAHDQARLLADMLEAAYRTPVGDGDSVARVTTLDEFTSDQIAFELTWSRPAVQAHLGVAQDLIERLPVVFDALQAGRIDLVRARAFSEALSCLDDHTATAVAAKLIGKAEAWTSGQLRERLRYHVLKADPDAGKKRYQHAVADRRVYNQPYTDGTASMGGVCLPPDRAAAAYDRIDSLARTAKADGDIPQPAPTTRRRLPRRPHRHRVAPPTHHRPAHPSRRHHRPASRHRTARHRTARHRIGTTPSTQSVSWGQPCGKCALSR